MHPHRYGEDIKIALVRAGAPGLTTAAHVVTRAATSLPNLELVVVCGIAGGYPTPDRAETHVRLGDILVGTQTPLDLSFGKQTVGGFKIGSEDYNAPDIHCRDVANRLRLEAEGIGDPNPRWEELRASAATGLEQRGVPTPTRTLDWGLPKDADDCFFDVGGNAQQHPRDEWRERFPGLPRVSCGAIDSGNYVGKDAKDREQRRLISDSRNPIGYEMEGAAVAKAATETERKYIQVRGVVDYQDSFKNDGWHPTGSLRAAAMARCILENRPRPSAPFPRRDILRPASPSDVARRPNEGHMPVADVSTNWVSEQTVAVELAELQNGLDLKDTEGVLARMTRLESFAFTSTATDVVRRHAAIGAVHALVVCLERGDIEGGDRLSSRISKLLTVAESDVGN